MKYKFLFLLVLIIAFLIRVFSVSDVPPGLNRDEAAIGYTAYSLLKTGGDEYGKIFPLSVKSFGDWKLPLYIYLTVPFVYIFGLSDFAVRLPSVIFGLIAVLLMAHLTKCIFKSGRISLISAGLLALSPWHIFFSRVASEANLAFTLTLLSVYLIFSKKTPSPFRMMMSMVILSLTLLTYHGAHVFTPILFILLVVFFRRKFANKFGYLSLLVFIIFSAFVYGKTLLSADKTKISGLLAVNDQALVYEQVVKNRLIFSNPVIGKVFNNKLFFFIETFLYKYLKSFSPEFLFIKGGNNLQHNIPDYGNLHLIEAPFFLLGLYFIFSKRDQYRWFWICWLMLAPIAAALTKDAPHSARLFIMIPAIIIVVAYGIYHFLVNIFPFNFRRLIACLVLIIYFTSVTVFITRYFIVFPYKSYSAWGKPYVEVLSKINKISDKYSEIVISHPDYSPYIYLLFYNKIDPRDFRTKVLRYPETDEGFQHVHKFDKYTFGKISWTDELYIPDRLYVDFADGLPSVATQSVIMVDKYDLVKLSQNGYDVSSIRAGDVIKSKVVDVILLPDNTTFMYLIGTEKTDKSD